jgi:hypothetical protein
MGHVEITQEQLAQVAASVFLGSPVEDIPEKLWIDYWAAGDQHYLRAIFETEQDAEVLELLHEIGQRLRRRYDLEPVCVAYQGDYSWQDVEAWVQRLHLVR